MYSWPQKGESKSKVVLWIVWFLHTGKETVYVRSTSVRVCKKLIETKQHVRIEFYSIYGASPYSSDLTTCDFWLFPALKKVLSGWQFCSDQEVLTATQTFINCLLKSQFHKTFENKRPERMQKCILSRGHYVEEDWSRNEDVSKASEYIF